MDNHSSATNETGSGNIQTKSSSVAGVLNLLLGVLGIHNFYLGKIKTAVVELIIGVGMYSIPFLTTTIPAWATPVFDIYAILIGIEGVLILTGRATSPKYKISEPSKNWHKVLLIILLVIKMVLNLIVMIHSLAG